MLIHKSTVQAPVHLGVFSHDVTRMVYSPPLLLRQIYTIYTIRRPCWRVLYFTARPSISQKQVTSCVHRTVHSFIYVYFNTGLQTQKYTYPYTAYPGHYYIKICRTKSKHFVTKSVHHFGELFYTVLQHFTPDYCTVHHIPLYFLTIGWILHVIQYIYISH